MSVVSAELLRHLQRQAQLVVTDLREQARSVPELKARLGEMYDTARATKRTGEGPTAWLDDQCEQAASSWVIACAFIRFCEDNDLTGHRWNSADGQRVRALYDRPDPLARGCTSRRRRVDATGRSRRVSGDGRAAQ